MKRMGHDFLVKGGEGWGGVGREEGTVCFSNFVD